MVTRVIPWLVYKVQDYILSWCIAHTNSTDTRKICTHSPTVLWNGRFQLQLWSGFEDAILNNQVVVFICAAHGSYHASFLARWLVILKCDNKFEFEEAITYALCGVASWGQWVWLTASRQTYPFRKVLRWTSNQPRCICSAYMDVKREICEENAKQIEQFNCRKSRFRFAHESSVSLAFLLLFRVVLLRRIRRQNPYCRYQCYY